MRCIIVISLEARKKVEEEEEIIIINHLHSWLLTVIIALFLLFKPITTAWSCVSKCNLITAIHTYRHVLWLASSSSFYSVFSLSSFLQDHRPLNRPVIGETLSSLIWTDKQHIHACVCVCASGLYDYSIILVLHWRRRRKRS